MSIKYLPPKQSGIGQFIDSVFILALVYVSLYIPLWMKTDAPADAAAANAPAPTWDSLGVTGFAREQWERLGYDAKKAADLVNAKFDYTIDPMMLLLTAAVLVGYFVYLLKASDRQYREVIAERFGDAGGARRSGAGEKR